MALSIQQVRRMRPVILSSVASNAVPCFPYYLIHGTIFAKKLLDTERVIWGFLKILFKTVFILRRIQRDIVINVQTSST